MPRHRRPASLPRQIQVAIQQTRGLVEPINASPTRRQVNGQSNTVQLPADSSGNRRLHIAQIELPLQGSDAVDQQLNGGIFQSIRGQDRLILRRACKRGEFVDVFSLDAQCLATGRKQVQCGYMAEELFCKGGSAINEMFAAVEYKELGSSSQPVDQKRKDVSRLYRKAERT